MQSNKRQPIYWKDTKLYTELDKSWKSVKVPFRNQTVNDCEELFLFSLIHFSKCRAIQASGLEGPIPSGISTLEKLTDLWVLFPHFVFFLLSS